MCYKSVVTNAYALKLKACLPLQWYVYILLRLDRAIVKALSTLVLISAKQTYRHLLRINEYGLSKTKQTKK